MSAIKLSTPSSGSISLSPANTASNFTVTIPAADATMVTTSATQTLTNKTLTSPTLTTPNIDSAQFATVSGTAPIYPCRAWVNFNGTGTVAIRGSGNVSSITDNNVGAFHINFTTAMPDANYSVVGTCASGSGSSNIGLSINDINIGVPATSVVYINTRRRDTNADTDSAFVCVSIFR